VLCGCGCGCRHPLEGSVLEFIGAFEIPGYAGVKIVKPYIPPAIKRVPNWVNLKIWVRLNTLRELLPFLTWYLV